MLKNLNIGKLLETAGKDLLFQLKRLNKNLEKIILLIESSIEDKHL
jgi:hypothetical protein